MSSPEQGLATGSNPSWSQNFRNRFHRYRVLLGKYWWVLALTVSVAVFLGAWYVVASPQKYFSTASLAVSIEGKTFSLNQNQNDSGQQLSDRLDTIKAAIKTPAIDRLATDRLQATYPDLKPSRVKLDITPQSSLLSLEATGNDPVYTQRYLQATLDSYLQKRREIRQSDTGQTLDKVREEATRVEEALKADGDAMNKFQRDNNIVIEEKGGVVAQSPLTVLNNRLDALQDEIKKLAVMRPVDFENGDPAQDNYQRTLQGIAQLKSEMDDLSVDMQPKHPKIVLLKNKIDSQQKVVAEILDQNAKKIAARLQFDNEMIKTVKGQITEAEKNAFKNDLLRVEFNKLADKRDRDASRLAALQKSLNEGTLINKIDPEQISIWENAYAAEPMPPMWLKVMALALIAGLGLGVGILLFIDRIDDRMGSISDFQMHFSEYVIGQIPRDPSAESAELLRPDDERHQLVESFRNLRSTLLYMPMEGQRPKTILITSAVPNEGKSTVSSNLALVLAFAGMKTLLIDCDLRRGAIHKSFDLPRSPGLTDVLGHNSVNWKLAIRESGVENLHILPRGRNVPQPSEYLLNRNTDALLKELYPLYDYIIIDSSPILAADDTASLAPKIDATLFVCRLSFTSAKMTRKSLEILYKRQANIPGLILNQVDTSSPEFVYYQYSEYYHAMLPEEEDAQPIKVRKPRPAPAPSESVKIG